MLESCRLWASWDLDWSVAVADLDGVPRVEDKKLVLKLRKVSSGVGRWLHQGWGGGGVLWVAAS